MTLVLVVDDEPLVRLFAADFLEQAGHQVIEASSADQAIALLEGRVDIEVVFSDVQMPGSFDGLRLMHLIKHRWPPIKLILTSGKARPQAGAMPGGVVFLPKPYTGADFFNALRAAA
jgi:CheY-like chemotaxis protein